MNTHLYLSLIPEALIASMLSPEEFGFYYAVGSAKKSRGQAIFFEVDPSFRNDYFRIEEALKRCVPHEDGTPKRSVYISVYRCLEHVPMESLLKLYLVTQDGRVLGIEKTEKLPEAEEEMHLYQEIAPVHPLVVSALDPGAFINFMVRDKSNPISIPALCFAELQLGELAKNPEGGDVLDLPYAHIEHLRQCLIELGKKKSGSKMVDRNQSEYFLFRTLKSGIYIGNSTKTLFYPLPKHEEMITTYYQWWRSMRM